MKKTLWFTVLLFLLTGMTFAGQQWQVDKAHSSVEFTVDHVVTLQPVTDGKELMTVGITRGKFTDFDFTFIPGDADFSNSRVEAKIRVESINTGHETRDHYLKSEEFFDPQRYPWITFKSTAFEKVGENRYKIRGDLTIKGITRPVELQATLNGNTVNEAGQKYVSFTATGTINRFDYGLHWSDLLEKGAFRISSYVNLIIQANLIEANQGS